MRRRAGRKYPHHFVFACHMFALWFGVQAVGAAVAYASGSRTVALLMGMASVPYGIGYMVAAMKRVYGGTVARALAHTAIVLFLYWLATIAVAGAIVWPVVF